MKLKRLLIVLTIILTLAIGTSVGYCGELDDPEPWSVQQPWSVQP